MGGEKRREVKKMVFEVKNKVGYSVLCLAAFTFAVFLLLNVMTLFNDEAVNPASSIAVAAAPADGHWVSYNGHSYCVCGPPYNCSGCKPRANSQGSHWEKIGGQLICMCGGPGNVCSPCVTRAID